MLSATSTGLIGLSSAGAFFRFATAAPFGFGLFTPPATFLGLFMFGLLTAGLLPATFGFGLLTELRGDVTPLLGAQSRVQSPK